MNHGFHSIGNFFKKCIFVFIVIIGISFQAGYVRASSSDAWYDSSWAYRKEISVSGNGTALTDYPIRMTVSYVAGKMNADFSDLRFIGADGATVYSYYIESKTDSVSAVVSVRVDSLPAAGKVFYMYYGNNGASSLSNGDSTFPIFDHFDDGSVGAEWTVVNPDGNQTITESGTSVSMTTDAGISNLDISTGNQDAPRIIQSISGNFVAETKISTTNASYDLTGILLWKDAQNFYVFGKGLMSGSERIWRRKNIADVITDTAYGSTAYTPDTVYLRMARSGTTVTCFYSSDNATWTQAFSETFSSSDPLSIGFVRFDTTTRTYSGSADWFLTKGYSPSELSPVWSGEETQNPTSLTLWQYRKAITIDHTKISGGSNLINFPVLVNLGSDAELAAHAQADGKDIVFTLSSGAAWSTDNDRLSHEIENYDSATGELQAWVRIPDLSSTLDTVIYMYYGNSSIVTSQENKTNVWDGNFKSVQHMNQDPSGTGPQMIDSTSYGNNGTSAGTMTIEDRIAGEIGKATDFDGADDYINAGTIWNSQNRAQISGTLWVKFNAFSAEQGLVSKGNSWLPNSGYQFYMGANKYIYINYKGPLGSGNTGIIQDFTTAQASQWYYLGFTLDATNLVLYRNGQVWNSTAAAAGPLQSESNQFWIGRTITKYLNGQIDEVRFSDSARSSGWIRTEYNNQSSPSTFLSLSAEDLYMHHFEITGSSSQAAGAAQVVTITAINSYGAANVGYSGDKTISLTGASTLGIYTPTFTDKNGNDVSFGSNGILAFTNGVATTTVKLYKAENASIDANDGVYDSIGDSSYDLDVVVSPASLSSFDIVAPAVITSETTFSLTLTAEDSYGNISTLVSDPTMLSVNSGSIDISSLSNTQFIDDGICTGNVIISEVYENKNIILTVRNGAVIDTVNLTVVGVSHGGGFIAPSKPMISISDIVLGNIPDAVTQIAISRTPDFADVCWQPIDRDKLKSIPKTQEILYLKFRTIQGGVSDVLIMYPDLLSDGDIVKTADNFDVYIIKYNNGKQYKRLILSPAVFDSYQHLKWENIKIISQGQLDEYIVSDLVYVAGNNTIYRLTPLGDVGRRSPVDPNFAYDSDSVYEINAVDRDSYVE